MYCNNDKYARKAYYLFQHVVGMTHPGKKRVCSIIVPLLSNCPVAFRYRFCQKNGHSSVYKRFLSPQPRLFTAPAFTHSFIRSYNTGTSKGGAGMSASQKTAQPSFIARVGRALARFFMNAHVSIYRATGGAVTGTIPGGAFLILTTTGRKSGQERDTPLFYFPDGDHFIVIASNGGSSRAPTWWLNLQAHPQAKIQVKRKVIPVTARRAEGEEKQRLWSIIAEKYQNF